MLVGLSYIKTKKKTSTLAEKHRHRSKTASKTKFCTRASVWQWFFDKKNKYSSRVVCTHVTHHHYHARVDQQSAEPDRLWSTPCSFVLLPAVHPTRSPPSFTPARRLSTMVLLGRSRVALSSSFVVHSNVYDGTVNKFKMLGLRFWGQGLMQQPFMFTYFFRNLCYHNHHYWYSDRHDYSDGPSNCHHISCYQNLK